MHRLWLLAQSAAEANGGTVLKAEAVESRHAVAVLSTMDDGVEGDQPVWVVQVEGHADFVCDACRHPPAATAPTGRYLLLVLDAKTFQQSDFGIGPKAANLRRLGTVAALHG